MQPQSTTPIATHSNMRIRRSLIGLFIFTLLLFILSLLTNRVVVDGTSMQPNFEAGQFLIINRLSYTFTEPQRGDIIVFQLPTEHERDTIKRIIGLPSEVIEFRDTHVYINGNRLNEPYLNEPCDIINCPDTILQLGQNQIYVMGDNRNHSSDSRHFGAIERDHIIGEALLRYWTLSDFGWIQRIGTING